MSSPSMGPRLFDVLPSAILKRSMRSALPAGSTFAWNQVGTLPVSDGQVVVMDAASYARPRHVQSEGKLLPWPTDGAEVWFQVVREGTGKVLRVVAALISLPGADLPPITKELVQSEVCSMAIDSATMMIADVPRLTTNWQGAGPNFQANLGGSTNDPARRAAQEQAAALLSSAGFRFRRSEENGYLSFQLEPLRADAEIERAESLLAASGLNLRLNVWKTETGTTLAERLVRERITQLNDPLGIPFLIASSTGFGDGIYYWEALLWRGNLVGYFCDFMPPGEGDDHENDNPRAHAAPQPPLPPPRIARPPILAGQIATLRHNGQFLLAKVQQVGAGGLAVQLFDGSSATVPAAEALPNPGHPVFQVGDQVLAHWRSGFVFPGTITAVSPQGYTVAWHDGDTPLVVPLGTLTFLVWAREAPAPVADDEILEISELDESDG